MSATRAEPVHKPWPGLIAAYRDRLPVEDTWKPITLLEGGTPLIHAGTSLLVQLHVAPVLTATELDPPEAGAL